MLKYASDCIKFTILYVNATSNTHSTLGFSTFATTLGPSAVVLGEGFALEGEFTSDNESSTLFDFEDWIILVRKPILGALLIDYWEL